MLLLVDLKYEDQQVGSSLQVRQAQEYQYGQVRPELHIFIILVQQYYSSMVGKLKLNTS
jgi:hypothetical protein